MVTFPGDEVWPALGLGTWRMGESAGRRGAEVAAVRAAIEMGYRVIDTAEMYGEGGAEEVVGSADAESLRAGTVRRDELFIVSKVYPHNASAAGTVAACERSCRRLGLDQIDCYLLHWRGQVPLAETVTAFEQLRAAGRIRHWGVSNFDLDDMEELLATGGGEHCTTNQVYYTLSARGPGFALLPWQAAHGIVTMAYSPIDQGALARNAALKALATRSSLHARANGASLAFGATGRDGDSEVVGPRTPEGKPRLARRRALDRGAGGARPRFPSAQAQDAAHHAVSGARLSHSRLTSGNQPTNRPST